MPHDDDETMAQIACVGEPTLDKRRAYAPTLTLRPHGYGSQGESLGHGAFIPHWDATEKNVPDSDEEDSLWSTEKKACLFYLFLKNK